ncbi:hypothetical protein [Salinicoccus bachuensis]|uniref:Uncharacterized protein n=1 Tax=Salinicoccus bachuensis TaxID=3136731 RepID=A0ABZ3CJH7_9STAP
MRSRVTTYVIAGGLLGLFTESVMTGVIAGAVAYIAVRYGEVTGDNG